MDLSKYTEQIQKTGFVLENYVLQVLKSQGWMTISNKYYIDDSEQVVREMDLIAYKTRQIKDFLIYTTLIISCKKSDLNLWAFLTRSIDTKDPNKNYSPLHIWSNSIPLDHQIKQQNFVKLYYAESNSNTIQHFKLPEFDVFAFQEMNKQNGTPQNDKAIFSSITSLMKSQSYEMNALVKRKKDDCIFQFCLINVVDSDFIRINFDTSPPTTTEIKSVIHINNYIIQQKEETARMLFVTKDGFDSTIRDYTKLHEFNCNFLEKQYDSFFTDVIKNKEKLNLLKPIFIEKVASTIRRRWWFINTEIITVKDIDFHWRENDKKLIIYIYVLKSDISSEWINSDTESVKFLKETLSEVYHYSGEFMVDDDDIPF